MLLYVMAVLKKFRTLISLTAIVIVVCTYFWVVDDGTLAKHRQSLLDNAKQLKGHFHNYHTTNYARDRKQGPWHSSVTGSTKDYAHLQSRKTNVLDKKVRTKQHTVDGERRRTSSNGYLLHMNTEVADSSMNTRESSNGTWLKKPRSDYLSNAKSPVTGDHISYTHQHVDRKRLPLQKHESPPVPLQAQEFTSNFAPPRGVTKGQLAEDFAIPFMGNYECSDEICTEFLTKEDQSTSKCCQKLNRRTSAIVWPGKCHFMNGTNRCPVYLKSYQGSGNTWVRGLLEQATGICTGSVYCDHVLKIEGGFNGEHVNGSTVLVVKQHIGQWVRNYSL